MTQNLFQLLNLEARPIRIEPTNDDLAKIELDFQMELKSFLVEDEREQEH